jgi:hypothetical protein
LAKDSNVPGLNLNYRDQEDFVIPSVVPSLPPVGQVRVYIDPTTGVLSTINANGVIHTGAGAAPPNFADAEVPSGSGTAFTLAHSPNPPASLILVWNGVTLQAGTGYTLSGSSLIMANAVGGGDTLVAWYRY